MPENTPRIVVDHGACKDGQNREGNKRELCRSDDEGREEVLGGEDEGNGGHEGEGENFPGEPGGFESEKKAPGFQRLAEVEGGGCHAGVEDKRANYGLSLTCEEGGDAEAKSDLGEDEHEGERPVSGLRGELGLVGWPDCGRDLAANVAGGGKGDIRGGSTGEKVVFSAEGGGVDLDDGNRLGGAGLHAGGSFAFRQTLVAHVTFANNATFVGVFRDVVRALENAILAADALVVEVTDDPGVGLLFVGADGAAVHALWFEAVMTGGGDSLLKTGGVIASFEKANITPGLIFVEAVKGVAGCDAGFATCAFVELDLKGVLFTPGRLFEGDEMFVKVGAEFMVVVGF